MAVPQPTPAPPAVPADVKEYTRVDFPFLPGLRCSDGTRPILYIDPAVDGPSDRWLITVPGGGTCFAHDLDNNGTFESGQDCADMYADPGERDEMGTSGKPAMKYLGTLPGGSSGIHSPDLSRNPVFARFNRVRVEKCSYDRYNGRRTMPGLTATLPVVGTFSYDLFMHGGLIFEATLAALRGNPATNVGLTFSSWKVESGTVVPESITLPALENATQVVLVGHSDGAHGLHHNVDRFADILRSWPSFSGDVRAVLDANFLPAAENEVDFDPSQTGDFYSDIWSGSTPELGVYDGQPYDADPLSPYVEQYTSYLPSSGASLDTVLDSSCVAAHTAAGDAWKCRSRQHVLAHHLSTPFFVREDFSDPNDEHTNSGLAHFVLWGPWGSSPYCTIVGHDPCPPVLTPGDGSPYRARLEAQAQTLVSGWTTRSELATGADASGPPPSLAVFMPDGATHEGTYSSDSFFDFRVVDATSSRSLRQMVEIFVRSPATGYLERRADGLGGAISVCGVALPFLEDHESGTLAQWSAREP